MVGYIGFLALILSLYIMMSFLNKLVSLLLMEFMSVMAIGTVLLCSKFTQLEESLSLVLMVMMVLESVFGLSMLINCANTSGEPYFCLENL